MMKRLKRAAARWTSREYSQMERRVKLMAAAYVARGRTIFRLQNRLRRRNRKAARLHRGMRRVRRVLREEDPAGTLRAVAVQHYAPGMLEYDHMIRQARLLDDLAGIPEGRHVTRQG